jgi:tetratricopeptide (TPR) repeat protein
MESDRSAGSAGGTAPAPRQESAPTKTIVTAEDRTKTMAVGSDEIPERQTGSFGIPTLVDVPIPAPEYNEDLESTKITELPAVAEEHQPSVEPDEDGGTRILRPESMALVVQQYSAPAEGGLQPPSVPSKNIFGKPVEAKNYVDEKTGKRRLLSRTTALGLALGILAITIHTQNKETVEDPNNIMPRLHTFPYVEVNVPPKLGITVQVARAAELVEKGIQEIATESPSAYIRAARSRFYEAVGRNPGNLDAKSLLASSYMRLSEVIPRDQRLFETLEKLLLPGPPPSRWTPEYVVALSEYYQLLNRLDQAWEVTDTYLKRRPTPELLYQKAKIASERREIDVAVNAIARAIPPANVQKANPRHLLLYVSLLEKKGQRDAVAENLKRIVKEWPTFGPGLLYQADFLVRNGKLREARNHLKALLQRPYTLTRPQLAEAFAVAARAFEGLHSVEKNLETGSHMRRALVFAEAAEKFHYDRDAVKDLLFRIKSKLPNTKTAYEHFVAGRQKEKAKQLEQAILSYVAGTEANRSDPTGFLLLAHLFEERGDFREAIDRLNKARKTARRSLEAALQLGRIYAERFELEESRQMIKEAEDVGQSLARAGGNARRDEVNFLHALVAIQQRRPELATPFFEKALKAGSRYTDLYVKLGDLEVEAKNEKLAEFYYSIALRYSPFDPKAMLGVALARFQLDSPSRAVAFLKDKLAAQPNSAAIMTNLAIIYLRSGDQEAGKNYLQNAIRSDAKYSDAFRLLGDLTKAEGDRQADFAARRHSYRYALASYEMYSKLAPNDPEGYRATADLYFDIRDLGAATKNYKAVLKLTPNYPNIRLKLAQISRNGSVPEEAMQYLAEELKINPRSDAALVERGNIYMAKKDFDQATKAFTEAARINEKNSDALFGLGVVYHIQGSFDNALSLFARVIKLDPLKADVYWQMGLIYQKQNNRARAIQAFTNYKGTIRDPEATRKADDKIRELQNK